MCSPALSRHSFALIICSACLREFTVRLAPHRAGRRYADSQKHEPRATCGPGRNLSSYETNYQQREIRSQGYLKSLPVPRPPSNFPTQKLGRCGPGGTRTRTL